MHIHELETPCLVIDAEILRRNIKAMQAICNQHGCALRPHIKTHKSAEIARMQVEAGAVGITCAKISEAEVMAEGGLGDIFIAYPLIGTGKIERAIQLAKKLERLILAVDSHTGAQAFSEAALRHGIELEVRLEVDTGAKRTGLPLEDAVDLAVAVSKLPGLRLTGLYTFKGMVHEARPTRDVEQAAEEECMLLSQVAEMLAQRGIQIQDLSAGSTPTGASCAASGKVTEIRPGTYVFYDQMCLENGACTERDIAAYIRATVVSTPAPNYAVIDGGSKTFPTDTVLNQPPLSPHSYGYVRGRDNLRLDRLSEEHGMLRTPDGNPTGLQVGDVLELIPFHICPAVNLQNNMYLLENGSVRKLPVDARGMVV